MFLFQVQIPGLENLQVFVPDALAEEKSIILQLLNAAAGKDCSKDSDEALIDDYLLLTKHGDRAADSEDGWAAWEAPPVRIVPPGETVDALRSMQVCLPALPEAVLSRLLLETLVGPMGRNPPGSSVPGVLQARMLEWVAMPFFRGSSQPRDGTQVSRIAGRFFTPEPLGKPQKHYCLDFGVLMTLFCYCTKIFWEIL